MRPTHQRTSADIVDVFAARATPAARRERPALFAARLAWAPQRLAGPLPEGERPLSCVAGVWVGDRVLVDLAPGLKHAGVVVRWVRAPNPHPAIAHAATVARVRLDGSGAPQFVTRARTRLFPLPPEPSQ